MVNFGGKAEALAEGAGGYAAGSLHDLYKEVQELRGLEVFDVRPQRELAADKTGAGSSPERQQLSVGDIWSEIEYAGKVVGAYLGVDRLNDNGSHSDDPLAKQVSAARTVRQHELDDVLNTLKEAPPVLRDSLRDSGTHILVVSNAFEDPHFLLTAGAAGYYDSHANEIVIHTNNRLRKEATVHELAHAWHGPDYKIESQQGFKDAVHHDLMLIKLAQVTR
jgi:hypothetical protein